MLRFQGIAATAPGGRQVMEYIETDGGEMNPVNASSLTDHRVGGEREPRAWKTRLDWVLSVDLDSFPWTTRLSALDSQLRRSCQTESFGTEHQYQPKPTADDLRAQKIVDEQQKCRRTPAQKSDPAIHRRRIRSQNNGYRRHRTTRPVLFTTPWSL